MGASELPYQAVPQPPDRYTAGTVLGRYMDGLGFRYHWATEGLSDQDIEYQICESSRSLRETLAHILNIVTMVECAFTGETYVLPEKEVTLGLAELRRATLGRIEGISNQLKGSKATDFETRTARFLIGGQKHTFPFWNTINGTMSDALHHVGQVVSFRRAAGNPIDPAVQVYMGIKLPPG